MCLTSCCVQDVLKWRLLCWWWWRCISTWGACPECIWRVLYISASIFGQVSHALIVRPQLITRYMKGNLVIIFMTDCVLARSQLCICSSHIHTWACTPCMHTFQPTSNYFYGPGLSGITVLSQAFCCVVCNFPLNCQLAFTRISV